jgi:hypothetical protein
MNVLSEAFWVPKAGNTTDEYEDAFWPTRQIDSSAEGFICAVADGATETSFSGIWANILVRAYCKRDLSNSVLFKSLPKLQKTWRELVGTKPLPWYAEEKLRSGAFSSILGLTLVSALRKGGRPAKWEAMAVGDSCLFQVRDRRLIAAFPLEHSRDFNSRPSLLSSNPEYNNSLARIISRKKGRWEAGDEFYLMTDALACWFLNAVEQHEDWWELISNLGTSAQVAPFTDWISELRKTGLIRNDDVTLLRVETA